MAVTTTDFQRPALSYLTAPFRVVFSGLMALTAAQRINREAEVLFNLDDAALAKRGLSRDELGSYLARGFDYI